MHGGSEFECRICRERDTRAAMISPCACRGSVALVHRTCLDAWLRTRYAQDPASILTCEVCKDVYGYEGRTIANSLYNLYGVLKAFFLGIFANYIAPISFFVFVVYVVLVLHRMPAWPTRALLSDVYSTELWPFAGGISRMFFSLVLIAKLYAPYARVRSWLAARAYTPMRIADNGYTPIADTSATRELDNFAPPAANTRLQRRTRAADRRDAGRAQP